MSTTQSPLSLSTAMKFHILALLLVLLISKFSLLNGCHDDERIALLSFKSFLTDPSDRLSSWQGHNCCSWQGILCSDSFNVITVTLRNPNPNGFIRSTDSELFSTTNSKSTAINGTISPSLFTLQYIRYLDLSFNNFQFSKIPIGLANLSSLTYLNLSNAMLRDSITTQLANLTSLRLLDLSCSFMIADISSTSYSLSSLRTSIQSTSSHISNGNVSSMNLNWLRGMHNLMVLRLSGVDLSKASQLLTNWAEPISALSNLRVLRLSNCGISGQVPIDQFLNLTHLSILSMDFNFLTSPIPIQLVNLTSLSILDLTSSHLQGLISELPHLKQLYLGANQNLSIDLASMFAVPWPHLQILFIQATNVIGSIPTSIANITSLTHFYAPSKIPAQIGELQNGRYLSFSGNKLFGPIPPSFCPVNNAHLMNLDLSNNSLFGTIPSSLGNCKSLISLNLGLNSFTGNIPNELQWAKTLSSLQLHDNHLDGPFPRFIRHLQNLEFLNLRNNRFTGKIPRFIGKLQNLRIVVLKSNSFNESIPEEITKLQKVQVIDFSNNKLSGPIPYKLSGLKTLRNRPKDNIMLGYVISFAYTGVELELVSKGMVHQLEVVFTYTSGIDLSRNSLTGNIPVEIGILHGLYMLNLSHNGLFGEIPRTIAKMRGLESLDLSFNYLSGEIPMALTSLDFLSYLNLSYNNLSGRIPTGMHFNTLYGDGSSYIGNTFLCVIPEGKICDNNNSSYFNPEMSDAENAREKLFFYGIVVIGYGVGFWGLFGSLYLMKEKCWNGYWKFIDMVAVRIVQLMGCK
ncbi:hypothetical protein HHK36_003214 [Tetracentron sinense]|uniref:Leucine-rich repeat-containing N-terminal plant-type domain-containing protein n=1 Tax=Tetracentron sinense TaxID=13715 RepID=A0A834ZNW8_TETSI|nr:hypothetical protein HHK36_003214 [Tetracentron sinense]